MADVARLAFDSVAGSSPSDVKRYAIFLHGMLGSGGNLRTIARKFIAARPVFTAWLVDLRGHGDSPKGLSDPSLAAAADDVRALCNGSAIGAVIGHSFGGKVALQLLQSGLPVDHVVTLDSNPGVRVPPRTGDSVLAVIEMLETLPPIFATRDAFIKAVIERGHSRPLAQWLAMSTRQSADGVRFALDLHEMRGLLMSYFAADLWGIVESPPAGAFVHLVIGEKSSSYSPEDRARAAAIAARKAQTSVDYLATDHWVHSEDPAGVLRILLERI